MNKFNLDKHPAVASGLNAPKHYFDHFPAIVMEKINQEQPAKNRVFTLTNFIFTAAAIVILVLGIPFFMSKSVTSFEQIDTHSLENHLSYQSNISSYDLMNLMESNELDALQVDLQLEDAAVENILITNPNFENYITE